MNKIIDNSTIFHCVILIKHYVNEDDCIVEKTLKKKKLNANHKEFGREIKKIGPQKNGQIPNKVYENNTVVSDTDVVLTK